MRAVSFLLYTIEYLLSGIVMYDMLKIFQHLILNQEVEGNLWPLYVAIISLYICVLLTMSSSINNCSGHPISLAWEVLRNTICLLVHIGISIATLSYVETKFHYFYVLEEPDKSTFPYFNYVRQQAIVALCCAVVHLMHLTMAIDLFLSYEEGALQAYDVEEKNETVDYIPARVYFLSEYIQNKMEKYKWFYDFNHNKTLSQ